MKNFTLLLLALSPFPAFADEPCADLWFSRNQLFNQAGYCFASALGASVFDNSDCTTKDVPEFEALDAKTIASIREEEARWSCKIDTSATTLALKQLELRQTFKDVAVNDGLESACLNYLGPDFAVYDGARAGRKQIGTIRKGDTIGLAHYSSFEGWQFVSYDQSLGEGSPLGWVDHDFWDQCENVAG